MVAGIIQSILRRATGFTVGVRFLKGVRDFSLLCSVQASSIAPIKWATGTLSPGFKRPELEFNGSLPSSVEDKNYEAIPPHPNTPSWRNT
jgi:hypothetical protein